MRHTINRVLYPLLILALFLSLTACTKSSFSPQSPPPTDQSASIPKDAPQPEHMDREDATGTVTDSQQMPEPESSAPTPEENADAQPVLDQLDPLKASTEETRCMEVMAMFFDHAARIRCGGDASDFMALIGGNEDLVQRLKEPGELLSGTRSFTSDLAVQACEADPPADGVYRVEVRETRNYDEEEMGSHEYAHTLSMTVTGPEHYCVFGIDSEYIGPVDDGYEDSPGGEEDGSSISIYDDGNSAFLYDGPPVDKIFIPGPDGTTTVDDDYFPLELEAQRTYGANSQIDESVFKAALTNIVLGDIHWATMKRYYGGPPGDQAVNLYDSVLRYLEMHGCTDTPLYELAEYRHFSAALNQALSESW